MLLVLFTTFFWTGCAYFLHRNGRTFWATSACVGVFLLSRFDLVTAETVFGHIDTLGNLNQLYAFDSIIRDHSFASYLSAWNPFNNGGQPLLPKFNPHFYVLWAINFIDPWGFKLSVVHNYLAVNYIVIFAVGMLMLCHALVEDRKSAFLAFFLTLFGTLLLVAHNQEIPRWLFMKPYIFLCLVEWVKRRNPWLLSSAMGFFGILSAQYLPNGTFLALFCTAIYFLIRDFSKVRTLLWNRNHLIAIAIGSLLCILAASPTIHAYVKTRNYVDGSRNFQGFYEKRAKPVLKAPMRTHNAAFKDLLVVVFNTRLSADYHAWFYSGPFLLILALLGLWGFRQSTTVISIGLSTSAVLFSAFFPVVYDPFPVMNLLRSGILLLNNVMFGLVILAAYGFATFKHKKVLARTLLWICCLGTFISFIHTHRKEINRLAKEAEKGEFRMALETEPPARYPQFQYPETRVCLGRHFRKYDFEEGTPCVTADNSRAYSGIMPERYARLLSIGYPKFFFSKDDYPLSDHAPRYRLFANAGAPLFFFTNQAKFPKGSLREELRQMFRDYESKHPQAAYFYPGDPHPTAVPISVPATAFPTPLSLGTPSRIELTLVAPTDGYLVRAENYDPDWKAQVNNRAVPVYYGNYAFQAIAIPSGKNHIVFNYETTYPWWFWLHQAAFLISGAIWVFGVSSVKLPKFLSRNTRR